VHGDDFASLLRVSCVMRGVCAEPMVAGNAARCGFKLLSDVVEFLEQGPEIDHAAV
jgi:hypothetical protein